MLKPFWAIFEKFKYLTTATLTPKRNTVPLTLKNVLGNSLLYWAYLKSDTLCNPR